MASMFYTSSFHCFVCLSFSLVVSQSSVTSSHPSQYETYQYTVREPRVNCHSYTIHWCESWRWWRWWRDCYSRSVTYCSTQYVGVIKYAQRCKARWIGPACNIPTCRPMCTNGMFCANIDRCVCERTSCDITPCTRQNNCYPGTCVNNLCKCPPGFRGNNCESFYEQPSITKCEVNVYSRTSKSSQADSQVAQAKCVGEGLTPSTVWIGGDADIKSLLKNLDLQWTATYGNTIMMPPKPDGTRHNFFVSNAPVPIAVSGAKYNIRFTGGQELNIQGQCPQLVSQPMQSTVPCHETKEFDSLGVDSLIKHNTTITVNLTAQLGGSKSGGPNYDFGTQSFTGDLVTHTALLKFDLEHPTHCLLKAERDQRGRVNCPVFPIYLDQDIRTDPIIHPLFLGWTDDGSGVSHFQVKVYRMAEGRSAEELEPVGSPLDVKEISLNNYQYTVQRSGVYSIVVTAYDYANNSATARKIFNYLSEPSYSTTNSPVFIREANSAVNYNFITSLDNPNELTLVWTGRFQAHPLLTSLLSKRIAPLQNAPVSSTIDDNYLLQFGQRSTAALTETGVRYNVSYLVDSTNGGFRAKETDANGQLNTTEETARLMFESPLQDGDTIVVWLSAIGLTRINTKYKLNVSIDTTRPEVTAVHFGKNAVDEYTSRVIVSTNDKESGIKSLRYRYIDKRDGREVIPDQTSEANIRDAPDRTRRSLETPCTTSDPTCYCTKFRTCYPYNQTIEINHCDIDKYSGPQFNLVLQVWVTNMAGIETPMRSVELGDITGILCRPTSLPPVVYAFIAIGGFLGVLIFIVLIILVVVVIVRIQQHKHPIPSRHEMRTMAGNVRNRLTMRHANRENNDYESKETSARYHAGQQSKNVAGDETCTDKNEVDPFKISNKHIQLADVLAEGKFAVVRKAYYLKMNSKDAVAAKALKNGFSQPDELLMAKKVSFMKNVSSHGNIVQFIGFIDEKDGQGPIMILELCDFPLKDWLANLADISTDDLELLLNFTLNIAQGVAHLHTLKIIHRRLAVRNVLLKQQANGLCAKLIGFGPTAEDEKTGGAGAGAGVAVPLKWMAPETLDSINSNKPVYNEKTDAWSYGVTVWEIYSKGAAPYPDVRSTEIKNMLKRGKRLQCPPDCSPDLFSIVAEPCWNNSAKERPTFSTIVKNILQFRSGSERPQSGYYGSDECTVERPHSGYYGANQINSGKCADYNCGEIYANT